MSREQASLLVDASSGGSPQELASDNTRDLQPPVAGFEIDQSDLGGPSKRPRARKGRATREQFQEIVQRVVQLLGKRFRPNEIHKYLRTAYGCSERTSKRYMAHARRMLRRRVGRPPGRFVEDAIAFWEDIIRDTQVDLSMKLVAQREILNLMLGRTDNARRESMAQGDEGAGVMHITEVVVRSRQEASAFLALNRRGPIQDAGMVETPRVVVENVEKMADVTQEQGENEHSDKGKPGCDHNPSPSPAEPVLVDYGYGPVPVQEENTGLASGSPGLDEQSPAT